MMTLREAMNRLFDEAFTRPFSLITESEAVWSSPAIDMYQTDNDVIVKSALPGIKADAVYINISGDTTAPVVTIKGEAQQRRGEAGKVPVYP